MTVHAEADDRISCFKVGGVYVLAEGSAIVLPLLRTVGYACTTLPRSGCHA